jgi:cyclopropane-fatty-acyl-phospholipid synthase
MDRYVFPDHFLATIGHTVAGAEAAGFEVRDVESLREHYKLTWTTGSADWRLHRARSSAKQTL